MAITGYGHWPLGYGVPSCILLPAVIGWIVLGASLHSMHLGSCLVWLDPSLYRSCAESLFCAVLPLCCLSVQLCPSTSRILDVCHFLHLLGIHTVPSQGAGFGVKSSMHRQELPGLVVSEGVGVNCLDHVHFIQLTPQDLPFPLQVFGSYGCPSSLFVVPKNTDSFYMLYNATLCDPALQLYMVYHIVAELLWLQ